MNSMVVIDDDDSDVDIVNGFVHVTFLKHPWTFSNKISWKRSKKTQRSKNDNGMYRMNFNDLLATTGHEPGWKAIIPRDWFTHVTLISRCFVSPNQPPKTSFLPTLLASTHLHFSTYATYVIDHIFN